MFLDFFEGISKIPRGSGNEKGISDYLCSWAKARGLYVFQDESLNILIKKPGSKGYENSAPVIIQGHLDMVCEKNMDTEHDFLKDPIKTYIDGDFIKAKGTTLGADNGIAVAMAMEILDRQDLLHPPIEVLMTTEEEVGLCGARAFDTSLLSGKYLINLDSGSEGEFLSSCAGGVTASLSIPLLYEAKPEGYADYNIFIKGLIGGHSGTEADSGRANSVVLLGRLLNAIYKTNKACLLNIAGGSADNAIPRESSATISIKEDGIQEITSLIEEYIAIFKKEYDGVDDGLSIVFEKSAEASLEALTNESGMKIIFALTLLPNGVSNMSMDLEGLVETSNNIGVIEIKSGSAIISSSIRSSRASKKEMLVNKFENLAQLLGGVLELKGNYPGWEFKPGSEIRKMFLDTYKEMFNKEGEVKAIHGGLECGIFTEQTGIDAISLGPDLFSAHNPDEKLSISSSKNIFNLVIRVLEKLK
ncbi:MAG: aminoacyl-histidine dipeptidase [Clostridiales bacterium]|jgi:dipeptidase D|nr:aminoacyl-histidine dipeptidase [Clostridiales bacterium]